MFKYFGLIHKIATGVNYTVVCGSSVADIRYIFQSEGNDINDIIHVEEMADIQWCLLEPVMCELRGGVYDLRSQFYKGGNIMAIYDGHEYGFKPVMHEKPVKLGIDVHGEDEIETGKAVFIDILSMAQLDVISLDYLDESHLMDKLSYHVLKHHLELNHKTECSQTVH